MRPGDQALFYLPGSDPAAGTPALHVEISYDGSVLNGVVPDVVSLPYYVAVAFSSPFTIRFPGLPFFVIDSCPQASISPYQGRVGTQFGIADPGGRIEQGDQALFYLPGSDPTTGTPALNVSITGSTYLRGVVPEVVPGQQYWVAVVGPSPFTIRFQGLPLFVAT